MSELACGCLNPLTRHLFLLRSHEHDLLKKDVFNLTEPWVTYDGRGLPPVDGCIEAFRKALGAPIFTDETITVFALRVRPLP